MTVYANEFDARAAAWLRALSGHALRPLEVDIRSIRDVRSDDLAAFHECHFFAGIGGWSLALDLAGWRRPETVWTGSCPCQPYSLAGKGLGDADDRNLWPDFFRLIRGQRPVWVFGEQVASAIGHGWLDTVFADLEAEGYTCGAAVLGAHSVGAPHLRQRLYWGAVCLADSDGAGPQGRVELGRERPTERLAGPSGVAHELGDAHSDRSAPARHVGPQRGAEGAPRDQARVRLPGQGGATFERTRATDDPWRSADWLLCRDDRWRPVEASAQPLVDGVPGCLGRGGDIPADERGRRCLARELSQEEIGFPLGKVEYARASRLKGYGNAIVPKVAAEFIGAFVDVVEEMAP